MNKALFDSQYTSAAVKALELFSVEPLDIKLVAHSENVSFRIAVRDSDTDYVLRLHRPGYNSIEELESERIWVRALSDAGIAVQDSLATSQGKRFELIDIPETGEQRYAGMTTWLEGTLLSDHLQTKLESSERKRIFFNMGEIAATIHNQSTCWKEPPGFERRRLDLEGLLGEAPLWGRFWEHADLTQAEQATLLRAREYVRAAVNKYGERPDNFSLIHSDLHPDNVILQKGDLALIDFDDSAYGWHMYDVASVLIEYRLASDFEALCAALLEGYREHRSLLERDVEMLSTFLLVRGMATIGWFHQRPEHTGSDYFAELKSWVLEECNSIRY